MSLLHIVKAVLLLFSGLAFITVIAPPRPAAEGKRPVYKGQLFELVVRHLARLACFGVGVVVFSHTLLLLSRRPDLTKGPLDAWLCPRPTAPLDTLAGFPPRFLAGIAVATLGCLLRAAAYWAMGSLFTFEVVIKDDHTLVTTGPYSYVRHPSYTGAVLILLGTHLIHFGDTGFMTHCKHGNPPVLALDYMWRSGTIFAVFSLARRCSVEDGLLRERFGKIWEEYQVDVPYRLLPYIY
ncbi:hypothetical protein GSI_05462 [Ganoderma sinense ZZ0214-1]|uniref:Protein-S-isoprenylcysteine O-methyltransferase n=1 Tax=Ganoderma sinense ZZ0214-1 TaxID=1077348 RepID=A0A2G8SEU4_9APHY|nr:hypothetical protein GSI_05462 [Ganoderma sinense ZZ0214-1]